MATARETCVATTLATAMKIVRYGSSQSPFGNKRTHVVRQGKSPRPPGTSRPRERTTIAGRFPDFPDHRAVAAFSGKIPMAFVATRSPVTVAGAVTDTADSRRPNFPIKPLRAPVTAALISKMALFGKLSRLRDERTGDICPPRDRFLERGSKGNGVRTPGCPCNCKRRAERPSRHWDFTVLRRRPVRH